MNKDLNKKKSISVLFNLFQLETFYQAKTMVQVEALIKLAGGFRKGVHSLQNIRELYLNTSLRFPERMWRIKGKDFILDIYDAGNSWFQVLKIKVRNVVP